MASVEKATTLEAEVGELCRWLNRSSGDTVRHLGPAVDVVASSGDVDAQVEADLEKLGALRIGTVGLEAHDEQLQKRRIGFLHPLAEGLRGKIHNLLTVFQHRHSPSAAT